MTDHKWLRHGTVMDGSPYYEELHYEDGGFHGHHRPVEWHQNPIYRYDVDPLDQEPMRRRSTVVLVADDSEEFWGRHSPGSNARSPVGKPQLTSEEDRIALESVVDGFDPFETQDLVAEVLSAMELDVLCSSDPGPDGGVDIWAMTTDLLTPEVPIFVQVKRYQWGSNIGKKAVRELRSGITFGGRGVFVTTSLYTKGAKEVAREPGFPHIALIDGPMLIDLIRQHWDSLSGEIQQKLTQITLGPE